MWYKGSLVAGQSLDDLYMKTERALVVEPDRNTALFQGHETELRCNAFAAIYWFKISLFSLPEPCFFCPAAQTWYKRKTLNLYSSGYVFSCVVFSVYLFFMNTPPFKTPALIYVFYIAISIYIVMLVWLLTVFIEYTLHNCKCMYAVILRAKELTLSCFHSFSWHLGHSRWHLL